MVCKPKDWVLQSFNEKPSVSDLTGGYLCSPSADIYNRTSCLTSRNLAHFNIHLNVENPKKGYSNLCNVLNALQSQPFVINKKLLLFIQNNYESFVEAKLLKPKFLAYVSLKRAEDLLRIAYFNNKCIHGKVAIDSLLTELKSRIRYEQFFIDLCEAYNGYQFDLPAFLDFRGRIYRSGVLHFHERDLARSLIVFDPSSKDPINKDIQNNFLTVLKSSTSFKYTKFSSNDDASQWYDKNITDSLSKDNFHNYIINLAVKADDPFQFLGKVLCNECESAYNWVAVTQDASASAYQIMSHLLLNHELGVRTNLLPSGDGKIQDLYTYLFVELQKFLENKSPIYCAKKQDFPTYFERKLIKTLFMPLVYGKSVHTMSEDIYRGFESYLSKKESLSLAKDCQEYFLNKFPDIFNLKTFFNKTGWFCSVLDRPVK